MVQYPVQASANVNLLYIAAARNRLYAKQGRQSANKWAEQVKLRFVKDAGVSEKYNGFLNGRWNHMMDQSHIGYTSWNDPPHNIMPKLESVPAQHRALLGVFPQSNSTKSNELPSLRFGQPPSPDD